MTKTTFTLALCVSIFGIARAADNTNTPPPEPDLVVQADPAAMIPAGVEFRKDVTFLQAVRDGEKMLEMFDPNAADLSALWRLASPIHHVRKRIPPILILQGAKDVLVKPEQATALDAKLNELGVEHQTVLIPETGHTFTLHSVKTMDIAAMTVVFFDKHLKPAKTKP